ncbi:class I SAM-dependent rRNA methyltransferase [Nitratiruptor tergarcus]|uniref:SAM-dependent methyltransferase n=1 Tax=Nitratiruptor tergarcus DSM 16512 TaxID=1069081 RepID=A0A1W1WSY7_9BACT|nr:class I SAM-dependent rRNA methyltransferase [Nitratiruptor tergarcus]SMC09407.1 SAM-dependent methyltransferase [Nitratiruptor tergarcus DSM 16512]
MKRCIINKKAAKKVHEFFPWVYKSDIISPLEEYEAGELVKIFDENEQFLAVGYINPASTITIRILSLKDEPINYRFFKSRILRAAAKRVKLFDNACRVIHSEGDYLPGLIVDRYGEYLSVQFLTAGILRFKEEILDILLNLYEPKGVYIEGEKNSLRKEKVEPFNEIIGEIPERVFFVENGIKFQVNLIDAQKTGFYLDQRRNRQIVSRYIKQKDKILDCFCHAGGFGLYAKVKKDADVRLVDISEDAIALAKENFMLNDVKGKFVVANVFDYLRELRKQKEKFDVIILDPPSFAKSRSKKSSALKGFKDITVNAMKLIRNEGYIALFSCSHHVGLKDLEQVIMQSSIDNKKVVEIVEYLFQDVDHPYILNNEFSLYLTGILFKVLDV